MVVGIFSDFVGIALPSASLYKKHCPSRKDGISSSTQLDNQWSAPMPFVSLSTTTMIQSSSAQTLG